MQCKYSAMNHNCIYKTFDLVSDLWNNLSTLNELQFDFSIPKYIYDAKKDLWIFRCNFSSNESCFN